MKNFFQNKQRKPIFSDYDTKDIDKIKSLISSSLKGEDMVTARRDLIIMAESMHMAVGLAKSPEEAALRIKWTSEMLIGLIESLAIYISPEVLDNGTTEELLKKNMEIFRKFKEDNMMRDTVVTNDPDKVMIFNSNSKVEA